MFEWQKNILFFFSLFYAYPIKPDKLFTTKNYTKKVNSLLNSQQDNADKTTQNSQTRSTKTSISSQTGKAKKLKPMQKKLHKLPENTETHILGFASSNSTKPKLKTCASKLNLAHTKKKPLNIQTEELFFFFNSHTVIATKHSLNTNFTKTTKTHETNTPKP